MDLFGKFATKAPTRKPKAQPKTAKAASKGKAKEEPKKDAPAINSVFKAIKDGVPDPSRQERKPRC